MKDRSAIPLALGQVLSAITSSKINARSAGQLLYGIQIASGNIRRTGQATPIAEKEYVSSQTPNHPRLITVN